MLLRKIYLEFSDYLGEQDWGINRIMLYWRHIIQYKICCQFRIPLHKGRRIHFKKSNLLLIKHKLKCEPAMVIHVCKSSIWRQKTPSVRLAYDTQRVHHQLELHSPCLKTTMVAKQSLQIRTKLTDTDSQADTVGWKLLPKFRYSRVLKMPSVGRVRTSGSFLSTR